LPENEADSMRLALTSLSSPLIANIYRLAGRSPTDQEIERVTAALNAVISYADSFAPAADATTRLSNLENDFVPSDEAQLSILYMSALLPAVNSVMSYSFGVPEKRLVQDVGERLVREAKVLRTRMFPAMTDEAMCAKADLALLRIASSIYSQCHFAEMAKLMATEEQTRQGMAPAMTSLWQAFILRMQMIEVLGDVLIPGLRGEERQTVSSSSSGGGKSPASPPASPPLQAVKPTQPTTPPAETEQKSNPMSFFVKKNSA